MRAKFETFPSVMLTLAGVATVLPIFGGYFCSFWLLLWLLVKGPWGRGRGVSDQYSWVFTPFTYGVLAMAGAQVISNFASAFTSAYGESLAKVFSTEIHMVLKFALLWLVVMAATGAARREGWYLFRDAPAWLLGWLTIHFVYCLAQREIGIDWVHGLTTHLSDDRLAYGVYRVNGFSGHPLSLAYNLTLLILASTWLTIRRRNWIVDVFGQRVLRMWWGILGVTFLTLLISGSRFPLAAVGIVLVATNLRLIWRNKAIACALVGTFAFALWWEGNLLARTAELFDQNVPLLERFPRLVYWRVNAQMFFDYPLFGVGQAGLNRAYEAYYAANAVSDKLYIAHNIFLQTAADSGAVGLLGLLAMLTGLFASARRVDRVGGDGSALRLMGFAGVACGLFQNNFRDSEFLFAFWFLTAALGSVSLPGYERDGKAKPGPRERESAKNFQSPAGRAHLAPHLPS